jgi:hypothetical protein
MGDGSFHKYGNGCSLGRLTAAQVFTKTLTEAPDVQLRSLYTVRFIYPDGWSVELKGPGGVEEQHYYFAEGRCEGAIVGTFRAGNHPRRRADHSYAMNMQGFIETDDGAVIMVDYQGFGRAYPPGRRQVVGAAWHTTDNEKYRFLNDAICTIAGEVRVPAQPPTPLEQKDVQLVFAVAELVWEAPPD